MAGTARHDGDARHGARSDARARVAGATTADFRAPSSRGVDIGEDRFVGRVPVALSFCGADDHGTQLAVVRSLSDELEQFGHRRVQLLVVVPWSADETRRAAQQERFQVPLLADPDGHLRERFSAPGEAGTATTFLIDVHGDIAGVVRQDDPAPHAPAVLERIDQLKEQEPARMAPLAELDSPEH